VGTAVLPGDTGPVTCDRRGLLLGGAALLLAGCTGRPGSSSTVPPGTAASTSPSASPSLPDAPPTTSGPAAPASETPSSASILPATTPWSADSNELQGAVKLVATRMVETVGTWDVAGAGQEAVARRLSAIGLDPGLASQLGMLLSGGTAARLQVVDAQYGGLLASSASVLIPTVQWVLDSSGGVSQRGWTFDVRLVAASPAWRVTEIHPSAPGGPVPVNSLATQVLGSSRIDLPPASRADIASGQVHDTVLRAMLTLSRSYTIGVSVIRSGHPTYVFGTSRPSDHPLGRAFDTWRINGLPVVASATPRALVVGYMAAAAAAGSYNVGGPYALSGSVYFTDQTHHDHVHAGFAT
jgi:hypothetical protein